jgi:hypothetical protein
MSAIRALGTFLPKAAPNSIHSGLVELPSTLKLTNEATGLLEQLTLPASITQRLRVDPSRQLTGSFMRGSLGPGKPDVAMTGLRYADDPVTNPGNDPWAMISRPDEGHIVQLKGRLGLENFHLDG